MKMKALYLVVIVLAGLISVAGSPPLHAAKTPPPITRDGLFKAIGMGGLSEDDLIGLVKDYGVDFHCGAEDERRLSGAKMSPKVAAALRANFRTPPVRPASTAATADAAGAESEPEEIVAGAPTPPAVTPPAAAAETQEVVAGGGPAPKAGGANAPAVEQEEVVVAGAPPAPPASLAAAVLVEGEEIVAGGAPAPKPSQPSSAAPESTEIVAGGPAPETRPLVPVVVGTAEAIPEKPKLALVAEAPVQPAPAPEEFVPAAPQRKVFPTVPAGLAPFVRGVHVVKVRVRIDERGTVQATHVLSMTGEQNDTIARLAAESAQKWQFAPAHANGKPVPSEQVIRFVL